MTIIEIPDDWLPTSKNINKLPTPLRRYIHELETAHGGYADIIHDTYITELNYQQLLHYVKAKELLREK